ncbi:hypothetical protein COCON_G00129890 [Conger conger]|uniref:Uncharacterized protein n=1 Tax=Conger conger TaxID=82655 RepID=A0A9Q1DDN0_CONCO|nr:hypothetical protein COCON_G00129890 [Conger conger]
MHPKEIMYTQWVAVMYVKFSNRREAKLKKKKEGWGIQLAQTWLAYTSISVVILFARYQTIYFESKPKPSLRENVREQPESCEAKGRGSPATGKGSGGESPAFAERSRRGETVKGTGRSGGGLPEQAYPAGGGGAGPGPAEAAGSRH